MADEDDPVVEEIVERIEKLERENRELRQKLENQQSSNSRTGTQPSSQTGSKGISRRKFLKMLGMGAGGLALSSSAAGLTWSKITPQSQGTSDIQAETAAKGVTNGSPFNIEDTSTGNNLFSATEGGPVNIQNSDLNLNQNNIDNVGSVSTGSAQIGDDVKLSRDTVTLDDDEAKSVDAGNVKIVEVLGQPDRRDAGLFLTQFDELTTVAQQGVSNEGATVLSGTTGSDGSLNIARDGNTFYIENRTGVNGIEVPLLFRKSLL